MRSAAPTASVGRTPLDVELPLGAVPGILMRRWRAVAAVGGAFVALVLSAAVLDYSKSVYYVAARLEVPHAELRLEMLPLVDPVVLAEEMRDPASQREIYEQAGVKGGTGSINRILAVEAVDASTVQITMMAADIDSARAMEKAALEQFMRRSAKHAPILLAAREPMLAEWKAMIENLEEVHTGVEPRPWNVSLPRWRSYVGPPVVRALLAFQGHLEDHIRDATPIRIRPARLAKMSMIYGEWDGEKYLQYGWTLLAAVVVGMLWALYKEGRARLAAAAGDCTPSAGRT